MSVTTARVRAPRGHLATTLLGDGPRDLLVLLPLAEERKGALRPVVELCRRLAGRGWRACVFDYYGTGDSPGDCEEVTWPGLRDDCRAALTHVHRDRTGGTVLLGVRVGALLALELAASSPERVARVLCWEPVLNTAAWLRGLRRRSRFRLGAGKRPRGEEERDLDGYLFNSDFISSLQDSRALPRPHCPCAVIGLGRNGNAGAEARQAARALAADLRVVEQPPFWFETGVVDATPIIEATVAHLVTGGSEPGYDLPPTAGRAPSTTAEQG